MAGITMAWSKEEKRDRRKARHELQHLLKRAVLRRIGLFSTGGQIRANIKIATDRFYAEQINPAAEQLRTESAPITP